MKLRISILLGLSVFCLLCTAFIADAVFHHPQETGAILGRIVSLAATVEEPPMQLEATGSDSGELKASDPVVYPELKASNAEEQTVKLGSIYEEVKRSNDSDRYKYMVVLTSKGAGIHHLISTEFLARDEEADTEALSTHTPTGVALLNPIVYNNGSAYSLANTSLKIAPSNAERFGNKSFPLDQLNWKLEDTDSKDEARFVAVLSDVNTTEGGLSPAILKITKTYRIQPGSYDLECDIAVENLSGSPIKVLMQVQGPCGISREGIRQDARKIKVAYQSSENGIAVEEIDITAMQKKIKNNDTEAFLLKHKNAASPPIWSTLTNKYFAAIVYQASLDSADQPRLNFLKAGYYPAPTDLRQDKDLHSCSFSLTSSVIELAATEQEDSAKTLSLKLFAGPKDKKLFENNETYKALQFFQTIDFRACCPAWMIAPMAFGIMWLMNTLFMLMGPLGNYGIVIIFLVFLVRLALHPITKKSQISMMRMQKLGPKMKEIQQKYANNKQEMNKQIMAMYRDSGVSPVSGMLPMFLQMPIWIALWTAVYTSVDLRGAGFLPFWITDLSMPDQLFAIPFAAKIQTLPYIGAFFPEYFNLLPILMGVVMYAQQKMMPTSQAAAQTNPQMAQQQKMMMILMPLMFPIMLYTGPSGVNLYIMTSIGAGVIEQQVIRKHLKEKEELEAIGKVPVTAKTGGKVKKKKPKPMFKDR